MYYISFSRDISKCFSVYFHSKSVKNFNIVYIHYFIYSFGSLKKMSYLCRGNERDKPPFINPLQEGASILRVMTSTTIKVINNIEFKFVCSTWETRYAWGHECTLYMEGEHLAYNKCRYYNRTWEVYQFQTCMRGAVLDLRQRKYDDELALYKKSHGIKRLTAKMKEDFEKHLSIVFWTYDKLLKEI